MDIMFDGKWMISLKGTAHAVSNGDFTGCRAFGRQVTSVGLVVKEECLQIDLRRRVFIDEG